MGSLFSSLSIAVSALQAEQGALNVTSNNVANINTPGYARQRAVIEQGIPLSQPPLVFGSGVQFAQPQSVRDDILELRLHEETQQQGQFDAEVQQLQQAQNGFQGTNDVGTHLTDFFNSLNQLSADPSSLPLRQGVLTAAGNLAASFRATARNLELQRLRIDTSVGQSVDQINTLTKKVAALNQQIAELETGHQDAGVLINQRTETIRQLSQLIDVRVVTNESSISLTTANGAALVASNQSFALSTQLDPTGVAHVYSQGSDITGKLAGGSLNGLLTVRDQSLPGLLNQLDTLAAGVSSTLNGVHRSGFDLNGTAGGDLFTPPPAGGTGAAASIDVAISDPALIAASSDGSPGSNGNVAALYNVRGQTVASGQNPFDYYASLVFNVGSGVATAIAESHASGQILQQLSDQRNSISGVSLDEEAANLIRYQNAYQAAARVITTISELTLTAINLGKD
jgi:flagellar hook-associated protein 1 FlgK